MTAAKCPNNLAKSKSQSAFVRGFIDDSTSTDRTVSTPGLNPRSCAASSMTPASNTASDGDEQSQSAFVRGFIDDGTPV